MDILHGTGIENRITWCKHCVIKMANGSCWAKFCDFTCSFIIHSHNSCFKKFFLRKQDLYYFVSYTPIKAVVGFECVYFRLFLHHNWSIGKILKSCSFVNLLINKLLLSTYVRRFSATLPRKHKKALNKSLQFSWIHTCTCM